MWSHSRALDTASYATLARTAENSGRENRPVNFATAYAFPSCHSLPKVSAMRPNKNKGKNIGKKQYP